MTVSAHSVAAVGIGLEKCLFVRLLYLQHLKEMHSTVGEYTVDSSAYMQYLNV